MNVTVKAIHFDVKASLEEFINKKVSKLEQYSDKITSVDVTLQVVKPETSNNKEVLLKVMIPGSDLVVTKTADSFHQVLRQTLTWAKFRKYPHLPQWLHQRSSASHQ